VSRKVVITGPTGTIGSRLIEELARDHQSGAIDLLLATHSRAAADRLGARGFRCVPFEFTERDSFARLLDGAQTLFLLRPYGLEAFVQAKQLIDAARLAGVEHVVHVSAHGAGWADTIAWIHLIDAYIAQCGIGYTHLRPGFFMDNVLAVIDPARRTITHCLGQHPVGWIAARDIARVAAAVIRSPDEHRGAIYALASESRGLDSVAQLAAELTGVDYRYVAAPADDRAVAAFVARGRGEYFSRVFIDYMRAVAAGEVPEAGETFANVHSLTGSAAVSWRDFLARHIDRLTPVA
jgi:uncharacterized protein YbjT (DUF2867 family)